VNPLIDRLAAYSWRLIAIGIVGYALLLLVSRLRVVVAPVVVALFLARGLEPVASRLRRLRLGRGLAAVASILLFFGLLAGLVALIAPPIADEADSIGPTLTEAVDDIEDWLVEDAPIEVSRAGIDRVRQQAADRFQEVVSSSSEDGAVLDSATIVAEVITGLLLGILLTFFMLRDGRRFVEWLARRWPEHRRPAVRRAADRAWTTLGGYLRGAAMLGIVESIAIGLALFFAGADLVVPVMILTFAAAFVPVVGAVAAGVVAVLVALVTAGLGAAVIVGIVALVVQQLDNDLLAPLIYGRALQLHPVVILLSVVAGSALVGIVGAVLAVPVVAVVVNVAKELRSEPGVAPVASSVPISGGEA